MYQNYCNNYRAAATRLAELREKSSSVFSKYCDEQSRSKQFNHLSVESLLILPIQRMPRYKMLLEEIIKNTEHDHPDAAPDLSHLIVFPSARGKTDNPPLYPSHHVNSSSARAPIDFSCSPILPEGLRAQSQ